MVILSSGVFLFLSHFILLPSRNLAVYQLMKYHKYVLIVTVKAGGRFEPRYIF